MTGYGKAECKIANQSFVLELRSLNSKQMDISLRIPSILREKELDIRNILSQRLERGKVDCNIYPATASATESAITPINTEVLQYYIDILKPIAIRNGFSSADILSIAMRMPDVTRQAEQNSISDDDWKMLSGTLLDAIEQFTAFRQQEGLALQKMFDEKLQIISNLLLEVETYEAERISKIRSRLEDNLRLLSEEMQQAVDKNRLEQEMIFYLEKLDITEEKVRLRNHIQYFRQTMLNEDVSVGKKLGFIAQEMGREINTLGSKSNHSEMQIIVVKMKDVLEQIKEQVLNVL